MWFTRISIGNPVLATMMMMAFVVLGLFSYQRLRVDQFPDVTFPVVVVQTEYPGAAPETVETDITRKVEEAVNTINGINSLISRSYEGQSVVIAGVSATFNGTRTITDVSDDHTEFTAAITASDVSFFNVIPSGTATLVGAGNYVGNSQVESAVLATAVEVFQSRTAAGGNIEGVDFQVTPFRLGRSLFNRVSGLLGAYLDVETMVG